MLVLRKMVGSKLEYYDISSEEDIINLVGENFRATPFLTNDIIILYDKNGKVNNHPINFHYENEPFFGDVLFSKHIDNDLIALSNSDINTIFKYFK